MRLINCKKCGALFQKKLRDICDNCLAIEDENLNIINEFIKAYPEPFISIQIISQKTGVNIKIIEELYKNGRLTAFSRRIITNCKSCGNEIREWDKKSFFCSKCVQQVAGDISEKTPTVNPTRKSSLRDFDKDIMHTKKTISPEIRFKYGFKKSFD